MIGIQKHYGYYLGMLQMTGYQPITTFWEDFSIADEYGVDAVKDTYKRAFDAWNHDYKYITEMIMILNWKSWEHSDLGNDEFVSLYIKLFDQLKDWAYDNFNDEQKRYLWETTD